MVSSQGKIHEKVSNLAKSIKYSDIKGTYEIVLVTVEVLKEIITNTEWSIANILLLMFRELMDIVTLNGKHLIEAAPIESSTGNMVSRILHIIREEYSSELKNKTDETDPQESLYKIITSENDKDIDFNQAVLSLKSALLKHSEFEAELETCTENITEQASKYIRANEIVMTIGRSRLVDQFFKKAAESRSFEVIIAEGAPFLDAQELAANLAKAHIKTTLISDAAIFAMMSRVNKVIIGTHTVMVNGGLRALTGSHTVAQAAKHYSVPVMVLLPLYKLSALYLSSYEQPAFNKHVSPLDGVINGNNAALLEKCTSFNRVFDYAPPGLLTLFISNTGGNTPSYIYRLISELYHPDDYEL